MENKESAVVVYEGAQALCKATGDNYKVSCPINGAETKLQRGIDFDVLPKTKGPVLLKPGAERIIALYGLLQRHTIVSSIEDPKTPFFMYTDRCDLVKIASDGTEYVMASAYGSANTNEKAGGFASPFDLANTAIKKAQKRATVACAIDVASCSGIFAQDIESESFMNQANDLKLTQDPEATITTKQMRRVYALAADAGLTAAEAKNKIIAAGFASTKDIKQKDYEAVCNLFKAAE